MRLQSSELSLLDDDRDEPDLPICGHCKGTVCVYEGCTPENHCPHGGQGKEINGVWFCSSVSCQETGL